MPTQVAIDIKQSSAHAEDSAIKDVLSRVSHESVKLAFFGEQGNAQWAADRTLKLKSTPALSGELTCNRNVFALEVGDAFVLNLTDQGLSDVVFRVMHIREADLESEEFIYTIVQDINYISSDITLPRVTKHTPQRDYSIDDLTDAFFMELPYAALGEEIRLVPIVSRIKGTETGYELHQSLDGGVSYIFVDNYPTFAPHGELQNALSRDVNTLSKTDTLIVDFDLNTDALNIETLTRTVMFSGKNLAVITDGTEHEIINFQTIVPATTTGRFYIKDIWRARYDTKKRNWEAGVDFYFIGAAFDVVQDENFLPGAERYFKVVPYNPKFTASIDTALSLPFTFEGRAYKPYMPVNLRANGKPNLATFATQVGLTWSPRVRGYDAGINDVDAVVDAAPTHEGFFKIEAYIGTNGTAATTIDDISVYGYTVTNSNIKAFNGGTTAGIDTLLFKLYNWKEKDSIKFDSEPNVIQVRKV